SSLLFSAQAAAATFVYVSNAEDGDIGTYTLQSDGSLQPGPHFAAEKLVMPMTISPDKRFLIAGVRSKPFSAYTYGIDRRNGSLKLVGTGPLAESFPYISLDRTGRFLLGASYGGHPVSVNPVGADGRVGEPPPARRVLRRDAIPTTTSGPPICTSLLTAGSCPPRSAPAARSAHSASTRPPAASLTSAALPPRSSRAASASIPRDASWSSPARNRKRSPRIRSFNRTAAWCRSARSRPAKARTGWRSSASTET